MPDSIASGGSRLIVDLARLGLGDAWYRWCDAKRDWSAESRRRFDDDDLATPGGGYAALSLSEFMAAFRDAGASVSKGSWFSSGRNRSFTAKVGVGTDECALAVQLGRGLNSMECSLRLFSSGDPVHDAELLHSVARRILQLHGQADPDPRMPYPRPIIGSRSQLQVVSRELVDMMRALASST
ncbi:hypothetical protein C5B85_02925 [Pseudoclavibacter sp. AY1F1]|nr:hypothetical protein C5B85_02925 [Pseudoclavibacter sp. AY1F1]